MVRAKFVVTEVRKSYFHNGKEVVEGSNTIVLWPQYDTSIEEDKRISKATPSGRIELQIDNPPAAAYLKPGEAFYLDFTAVNASAAKEQDAGGE